MSTTLHSFIDIFDSEFETDETSVKVNKIVIPIIQRDYAQGRENPDVSPFTSFKVFNISSIFPLIKLS